MRLNKLILRAFGHFTDTEFDFGAKREGKSDFHIFYGANEAGKTTLMEAWLRFLFGIPARGEQYAFRHERQNLKLAAELEHQGKSYALTRRPQKHSSVLEDADGQSAEFIIQSFLGNLRNEQDYRHLLCLDDTVIEKGGQEIMASKGEMGNLLFSAAAGLADFSQILEQEREKQDTLYKPRGQNTKLAELRRAIVALDEQIKKADISAPNYQQLQEASAAADTAEQELQNQRRALAERKRLAEAVLDKYRRHEKLQQDFAAHADELAQILARFGVEVSRLHSGSAEQRYQALAQFILTPQQIDELRRARAEIAAVTQKQTEIHSHLAEASERCETSGRALAQLRQNLPPPQMAEKLAEALEQFGAAELKQDYRAAQERQKVALARAQKALAELTLAQGQHFDTLPAAGISARSAQELAQTMREARAEHERAERAERAAAAQLDGLKEQLAPASGARS